MEMQKSELAKVILKKNKVGRLILRHTKSYYDSAVIKKWDVGTTVLSSPVGQNQAQKQTREYVTAEATAVWKGNAGIFHRRISLIGMWEKKKKHLSVWQIRDNRLESKRLQNTILKENVRKYFNIFKTYGRHRFVE